MSQIPLETASTSLVTATKPQRGCDLLAPGLPPPTAPRALCLAPCPYLRRRPAQRRLTGMPTVSAKLEKRAQKLRDQLTLEEKVRMLSGSKSFYSFILGAPGQVEQPRATGLGRRGAPPGAQGLRLQRRSARHNQGPLHLLPGAHGAGGHLLPRVRGAGGRGHGPRGPGAGGGPGVGPLHKPAAPSGLGPGAGDLRRRPPAAGRHGRGLHPRGAEARPGLREALRLQQHRRLAP